MPVVVKQGLPAIAQLESENVFLMTQLQARKQDIRTLEIAVLNLMPTKIETETQILRLLSNSPLQIHVTFVEIDGHESKHTSPAHLDAFYISSSQLLKRKFDGLIITGAPVEFVDFEQIDYWSELVKVFEWSRNNVYSTFHICWSVQAALYHFYGIGKQYLPTKLSGVYPIELQTDKFPLTRGIDKCFLSPQSRYCTITAKMLSSLNIDVLASGDDVDVSLFVNDDQRQVFFTGHLEYDLLTLDAEYKRDMAAKLDVPVPHNYYPADDPKQAPVEKWKANANLLFGNWLNYNVYQATPFAITEIQ